MTDAVFSKEYAASLVQRARRPISNRMWIEWYRETCGSMTAANAISAGTSTDYGTPRDDTWPSCYVILRAFVDKFINALLALGSLCQLPEEWTESHREAAREIGGG